MANDYSNPHSTESKFCKKRFIFFDSKSKEIQRHVPIVDNGNTVKSWTDENYHHKNVFVTYVNLQSQESTYSTMRVINSDVRNLLFFKDTAFDVAVLNPLIEHPYTKENQLKMVKEAKQVGRSFFIQTPNRYFPIEPHFKFSIFQSLPKPAQVLLETKILLLNGVPYSGAPAKETADEIKFLSKKEMIHHFPDCHLRIEYFLGLKKLFIVHNFSKN